MKGAAARRHPVPSSVIRTRLGRRARRLRHAGAGHRRGAHRAGSRRRRLPDRREVRARRLRTRRRRRTISSRPSSCSAGERVFDANPHVEEALAARGRSVAPGDAGASVSALLALPQPGDLPRDVPVVRAHGWRPVDRVRGRADRARCARPPVTPSTIRCGGFRPGDATASTTWCRTVRTGASHGSGSGASRFRRMACTSCGEAVMTAELVERAAAIFEQYSADAWYERPIEEFLPPGFACPSCGGTTFERETDILDVWFDSGSSHEAVLPRYPGSDVAFRHVSRGERSAPGLVSELAAGGAVHAGPAHRSARC